MERSEKLLARSEVAAPPGRGFFGVVTWTRIRELDWTEIATAADPGTHLIGWMETRAREWVDDGIAERLAVLSASTDTPA
jgi:hypothetical protein